MLACVGGVPMVEDILMKLSEPDWIDRHAHEYIEQLESENAALSSENQELKARLTGLSQRAEDLQQAAVDMETVLNKLRTGG